MMALTLSGHSQFNQPILYIFVIVLGATAALQIKYIGILIRKFLYETYNILKCYKDANNKIILMNNFNKVYKSCSRIQRRLCGRTC